MTVLYTSKSKNSLDITHITDYNNSTFNDEFPHLTKSLLILDLESSTHPEEWSPLILGNVNPEETVSKIADGEAGSAQIFLPSPLSVAVSHPLLLHDCLC